MSSITFTAQNAVDPGTRPNGTVVTLSNIKVSSAAPTPPTANSKTTTSLDGTAGVTRIRGFYTDRVLVIPYFTVAQLPDYIDFARAIIYGYSNPFTINLSDIAGRDTVTAVCLDTTVPIDEVGCSGFTMTVPYRVVS